MEMEVLAQLVTPNHTLPLPKLVGRVHLSPLPRLLGTDKTRTCSLSNSSNCRNVYHLLMISLFWGPQRPLLHPLRQSLQMDTATQVPGMAQQLPKC